MEFDVYSNKENLPLCMAYLCWIKKDQGLINDFCSWNYSNAFDRYEKPKVYAISITLTLSSNQYDKYKEKIVNKYENYQAYTTYTINLIEDIKNILYLERQTKADKKSKNENVIQNILEKICKSIETLSKSIELIQKDISELKPVMMYGPNSVTRQDAEKSFNNARETLDTLEG